MGNKSLDSLHDVLRRTIERKPITTHWKNGGKIGCLTPVGDAEVASMHCDAHHYLRLKDRYCSGCAEAARQALDQSEAMTQYEVLATQALEAQRMRDEGAEGIAAQIEELLEKRLGEMVYANGFPLTGQPVEPGGRKPPPTPTEWLDITARNGELCVAWNSDRYLLTDAQARKLRDTLSALVKD